MNRYRAYIIIGPELLWVLMFVVAIVLVAHNKPPTAAGNQQLEFMGWFLPWVGVLLSLVPLSRAPGSQWWWLLRIVIVSMVGVCVVTGHLCGGIDWGNSSSNDIIDVISTISIAVGFTTLLLGAAIVAIIVSRGSRS